MIWLCICLTLGHTAEPGDANHPLSLAPESAVTPAVSRDALDSEVTYPMTTTAPGAYPFLSR